MSTLEIFELFPDLPGELRNKVYRLLPYVSRRIIEVNLLSNYEVENLASEQEHPTQQLYSRPVPLPQFLAVSREMRAELRPDYEVLLRACPTTLVNFASDIIHFKSDALDIFEQALENDSTDIDEHFTESTKIQTLLLTFVTEDLLDLVIKVAGSSKQFRDSLLELQMRVHPADLSRWETYVKELNKSTATTGIWNGLRVVQGPVPLTFWEASWNWNSKKQAAETTSGATAAEVVDSTEYSTFNIGTVVLGAWAVLLSSVNIGETKDN